MPTYTWNTPLPDSMSFLETLILAWMFATQLSTQKWHKTLIFQSMWFLGLFNDAMGSSEIMFPDDRTINELERMCKEVVIACSLIWGTTAVQVWWRWSWRWQPTAWRGWSCCWGPPDPTADCSSEEITADAGTSRWSEPKELSASR